MLAGFQGNSNRVISREATRMRLEIPLRALPLVRSPRHLRLQTYATRPAGQASVAAESTGWGSLPEQTQPLLSSAPLASNPAPIAFSVSRLKNFEKF
jgi:hypothetical protein